MGRDQVDREGQVCVNECMEPLLEACSSLIQHPCLPGVMVLYTSCPSTIIKMLPFTLKVTCFK